MPEAQVPVASRSRSLDLVGNGMLAAACFAAAQAGPLQFGGSSLLPVWLPAGVALGALLLWGLRLVPGAALGVFAAALFAGQPVSAALTLTAATALGAWMAGWLLLRTPGFSARLDGPRQLLQLMAVGAFLAPLLSATLAVLLLAADPLGRHELTLLGFAMWWAQDALGVVLVTPLILAWAAQRVDESRSGHTLESIGLALLQVLVYVYVFIVQSAPQAYLCLPLALLSALYLELRWVAVANLLTFSIAAGGTLLEAGPFAAQWPTLARFHLQSFGIVACLTALVVATLAAERRRNSTAVKESAERFRQLAALSSDWYWEQDENLRFTYISDGYEQKSGLTAGAALGKTRFAVGNQFDSEAQRRQHEEDLAHHRPFRDVELHRYTRDGELRFASISAEPVLDQHGRFRGYRGVGRDVTRRKLAERALRASEARLKSLVDLSYDWYWEQDENLRFTVIAGRAADDRRVLPEQIIGKTRWEDPSTEVADADRRSHDAAVAARLPFRDVTITRHNMGAEPRVMSVSGEPIFDDDGRFRGYRGVARDVTLQFKAEREIAEAKRFLDALIAAFPSPILIKDAEHRYVAANAAFCRFFRRDLDQILGKTDYDFFSAEDAGWFQEADRRALEGGSPVEYERPYPIAGRINWMLVRKTALTRPDGNRVVVLLLLDVTERRAAEEALRASEQRFRSLTQLSADWYWEQDRELRFTFVSGGAAGGSLTSMQDTLGKTRFELELEFESEKARQDHLATLLARRPFRDLPLHGGPSGHWVLVSGEPVFDPQGEFIGYRGVGRDVTAQRQAQAEIAEGRKFLDELLSAVPTPISVKDAEHRFVHVNDAFCQLTGQSKETLLGADDRLVLPAEEAEFAWQHDDEALESDQPIQYEHIYQLGGETRWMLIRKCRLSRPDGSHIIVSSLIDISNLKAVEAALRGSEARMKSLLELSADWLWEQDQDMRYTYLSAEAPLKGGFEPAVALGRTRLELPYQWESQAQQDGHLQELAARRTFRDLHLMRADGENSVRHVSISGVPVLGSHGEFLGYRGTGKDITERMLAEHRIARLKEMYAAMTEANDAIIHSKSTDSLFAAICRIAVDYGHFVFARIALIEHQTGWVHTIASAGTHNGYADKLTVSIDDSRPEGQGSAAYAARTGTNYISNDTSIDERSLGWRETLAELGIRAQATMLLRRQGSIVGTLHLYADQVGVFDEELTAMLERLAANLSFALDNFQRDEARKAAEAALRESETRFRDFADAAGEYVWEADLEDRFTYVSSRVQSVWSFSDQELIGRTPFDFMPPGEDERVREWLAQNVRTDGSFRDLEHRILTRNAETRWLLVNAVGMFDEHGTLIGRRGTGRDVTDRKTAEARISYLATRDPLTELPNRVLFNDRLEQGIVAARRGNQSLALLFIDLDRFKYINDSLGHQIGDVLLKEVAARMLSCVRKGDTLSRLGGDEFVVTLDGLEHAEDAGQVAAKIIKTLARPFEIAGHTLTTSCSIGISIFPLDAEDDRTLMKNADTAMYHAKEKGRNNYQFFSSEMNVRAVERHNLETALRRAIDRQEFVLFFQPQVDIRSGRVVGMEALLRWEHPERGLLLPSTFIGVAEESGLIDPIGQWVLRSACQRAKAWQDDGHPPMKIAVNISARQLNRPRDFSRALARVLSSTGLDPRYLELEMTESLLLHNADENIAVLRRLGKDGVRIAVDDFGTGYSSLSYLRQLPIDTLKIDRSFVRDIEIDSEDAAIVHAVVAMGHSLELQVTAEGVETRGQLEALARIGCDEYQGYLFSKPVSAADAAARFLAPRQLDLRVSNS
jgi:diguanylate cyclase (GGDEF)-like protein/PAS domain S-box-containing protein